MRCRFRLRNRLQTKKLLYASLRAVALHLIRRLRRHLPLGGEGYSVRGRTFNNLSFDLSALCDLYPILPADSTCGGGVATHSGGQGASPLQLFLFLSFSFSGERKTDRRRRSRIISVAKLPHSKQPIHNPRNRSTHNGAGRKIKFF